MQTFLKIFFYNKVAVVAYTPVPYMQDELGQACNVIMLTCNVIYSITCNIREIKCDLNYVKLHVYMYIVIIIVMMHVDIIYLACCGQKGNIDL